MHAARRKIKWATVASVVFLFLVVAPTRASTPSTKAHAPSLEDITRVLSQRFAVSIPVINSRAVYLNGEFLNVWSDGDEEDKKNNDKDDQVPEPGVILQLVLGLLGVAGLRLLLKPQESNPR